MTFGPAAFAGKAMTAEEAITSIVGGEYSSYRDLPVNLYQINWKYRDELRPRFGLLRAREFLMKDAYSFHVDVEDLKRTYQDMYDAYSRVFTRCALTFRAVEGEAGEIGGDINHEFMAMADVDWVRGDYDQALERYDEADLILESAVEPHTAEQLDRTRWSRLSSLAASFLARVDAGGLAP